MQKYWGGLAVVLGTLVIVFLLGTLLSCASLRRDPLYDGDSVIQDATSDTTTLIRLTIQNNRISDASDPQFYLKAAGQRHSLGIVSGMGGKKIQFVDTRWFGADGCMTIIAHYVGLGDFTFPQVCWRAGYVIDVSLQELFRTSSAWAHA